MRPQIVIEQSVAAHVRLMGEAMREEDRREATLLGEVPHRLLWRSWKQSILKRSAFVEGEIAAMWGVSGDLLSGRGTPWLVTAPACERVTPLAFARVYRDELREMAKLFPVLENYVDSSYRSAIRMLEISGFEVGLPKAMNPTGALFRPFRLEA